MAAHRQNCCSARSIAVCGRQGWSPSSGPRPSLPEVQHWAHGCWTPSLDVRNDAHRLGHRWAAVGSVALGGPAAATCLVAAHRYSARRWRRRDSLAAAACHFRLHFAPSSTGAPLDCPQGVVAAAGPPPVQGHRTARTHRTSHAGRCAVAPAAGPLAVCRRCLLGALGEPAACQGCWPRSTRPCRLSSSLKRNPSAAPRSALVSHPRAGSAGRARLHVVTPCPASLPSQALHGCAVGLNIERTVGWAPKS
jgi:hypothetical protein